MRYQSLLARQIFTIQEKLLGRKTGFFLKQLDESQWYSASQLERIQLEKLQKLLKHAYTTVPYYRELMDTYDCRPDTINNLSDLCNIPVLSKDAIRERSDDMLSVDAKSYRMRSTCTTGSTGQYLDLLVSAERVAMNNALENRNRQWLGADFFGKKMLLWGRPQSGTSIELVIKKGRDALLGKRKFLCDSIGVDDAYRFVQELDSWQPEYLYCYAGSIAHMARLFLDNDLAVSGNYLKGIVTTAEVLFDYQRSLIEKAFNVQVYNEYGSAECGLIAHECEYGQMHINSESVIVEVDPQSDDRESGDLIITNLHSYGLPIIRYQLGDVGKLSRKSCQCGRGLPLLEAVFGRTVDAMYNKYGKRIDSLVIDTIAEDPSITMFKIHQKSYTDLDVTLFVTDEYNKIFEERFVKHVETLFEHEVKINFIYLDKTKVQPKGKLRHITSDVTFPV